MYVDVSQRFREVAKHLLDNRILKNQAELALTLALSSGYMSQLMSGQREPSSEVVSKLANAFPFINKSWLLTGNGDMVLTESKEENAPNLIAQHIPQLSNTEILLRDMLAEERVRNETLNEMIWELKEENGKLKALLNSERKGGFAADAGFSSAVDAV